MVCAHYKQGLNLLKGGFRLIKYFLNFFFFCTLPGVFLKKYTSKAILSPNELVKSPEGETQRACLKRWDINLSEYWGWILCSFKSSAGMVTSICSFDLNICFLSHKILLTWPVFEKVITFFCVLQFIVYTYAVFYGRIQNNCLFFTREIYAVADYKCVQLNNFYRRALDRCQLTSRDTNAQCQAMAGCTNQPGTRFLFSA